MKHKLVSKNLHSYKTRATAFALSLLYVFTSALLPVSTSYANTPENEENESSSVSVVEGSNLTYTGNALTALTVTVSDESYAEANIAIEFVEQAEGESGEYTTASTPTNASISEDTTDSDANSKSKAVTVMDAGTYYIRVTVTEPNCTYSDEESECDCENDCSCGDGCECSRPDDCSCDDGCDCSCPDECSCDDDCDCSCEDGCECGCPDGCSCEDYCSCDDDCGCSCDEDCSCTCCKSCSCTCCVTTLLDAKVYTITVAQASQTLSFSSTSPTYTDGGSTNVTYYANSETISNQYNFAATKTSSGNDSASIAYSVDTLDGEDGDASSIATLDESGNGTVTVVGPGAVKITATLAASTDGNYAEASITHTLLITQGASSTSKLISFSSESIAYTLGTSATISNQTATVANNNVQGVITYTADTVAGVSIDSSSGAVTVTDYDALSAALRAATDKTITMNVTANKAVYEKTIQSGTYKKYDSDTATYQITISFETTPTASDGEVCYTLSGTEGSNDWYTGSVTVTPNVSGDTTYTIASSASGSFGESVVFSDEGSATRYIYLKNSSTGGITDRIEVSCSIDSVAPVIKAENSGTLTTVGGTSYYNSAVTCRITVTETNFVASTTSVTLYRDGTASAKAVSWTTGSTAGTGSFTINADGIYYYVVTSIDIAGNSTTYTSDTFTVDVSNPTISLSYSNTSPSSTATDSEGHSRSYYSSNQSVTVVINEHNFTESGVSYTIVAKDAAGTALGTSNLYSTSAWVTNGDIHTQTITFSGDANYTLDVSVTDTAGNTTSYATQYFTVDKTAPTDLSISYSTSVLEQVLSAVTFGFYKANATVTVTATDATSGINGLTYSYANAAGVSSVNQQLLDASVGSASLTYSSDNKTVTYSFTVPQTAAAQFNGNVSFEATDRSGNSTSMEDSKRIVVDSTAPTCQVSYTTATNTADGVSYYDGSIDVTVVINEANFYSDDVVITLTTDGVANSITPSWSDTSVDVHVGTFTLSADADYTITIDYTDKSGNAMATYTSEQLTVDTDITAPSITINGSQVEAIGGSYAGDAAISYSFEDTNYLGFEAVLTRARFDSVEDVTEAFLSTSLNSTGGSGSFIIDSTEENDGIYVLSVTMTDLSGHEMTTTTTFTINRYGAVYTYSSYLASIIADGGQYLSLSDGSDYAITEDLVITEYNASEVTAENVTILITRDGAAVDADYTITAGSKNTSVAAGDDGWYEYSYTISAANFAEDGVYKLSLVSTYATDDSTENDSTSVPENSTDESGNAIVDTISFTVDTTAPEIRNITNTGDSLVNATSLDIDFSVVDVGGLACIQIMVDGSVVEEITDFSEDAYSYAGTFTLTESTSAQAIRLVVTDKAGNVTDTADENFDTQGLFDFNDTITVSTNFWIRFLANKGAVAAAAAGGVAVVGGGVGAGFAIRKRRFGRVK